MITLLLIPFILAFVLLVWFKTDAFTEYGDAFGYSKFIPTLNTYSVMRKAGTPLTYVEYLQQFCDSFIVRLLTCEICLSAWLGIVTGIFVCLYLGYSYGVSSLIFGIIYSAALPYLSLFAYRLILKIK